MADALTRAVLAGSCLADGVSAATLLREVGLVIVEGVPDFLTWATRYGDAAELAPGILGVIAGSWSAAVADRIPDGVRIAIRTHLDPAGDKYSERIVASLSPRCECFRLRQGSHDVR